MCEAMTIAAIGAGLSLMQQQAQADAINDAAEVQDKNIREATAQNYNQLNRQGVEDAQNAAVEGAMLSRQVTQRVATGRASVGASGISGLSVNAMLLDLAGKGLEAQTSAETNYARQMSARNDQAAEIQRGAAGQLSGVQRAAGVGALDVFGAGLKVASAYSTSNAATLRTGATGMQSSLAEQRAASRQQLGLKP